MAGSTNFLQWNPNANNQETDAAWAADTLRLNGAPAGASICPSVMDNKFRYQMSTFIAAFAQALANKGYTISDASLSTLIATLAAVITLADLAPYELHSSMTADVEAIGDPRYLQIANFLSTLESYVSTLENNYFDPRYAQLAGNSGQVFSVANASSASQAVAFGQALGLGQTWQNVTGSRTNNTTYYNTTGRPIFISAWGYALQTTSVGILVNGVQVAYSLVGVSSPASSQPWASTIVPPGASYAYEGAVTFFELR
jgi:hypothetical protein